MITHKGITCQLNFFKNGRKKYFLTNFFNKFVRKFHVI